VAGVAAVTAAHLPQCAYAAGTEHAALNGDGSEGFAVTGVDDLDYAGSAVAGVGDVNGDGIDDFIIGAHKLDAGGLSFTGECYVVFGRATGFPPIFPLAQLFPGAGGDGSNGFVLEAGREVSGRSVDGAGDVNGDGIDDIIIGAPYLNAVQQSVGGAYVVFGRRDGFPAVLRLESLSPGGGGDGSEGFVILGDNQYDNAGRSARRAGDVNGDGMGDLVIGAPGAYANGNAIAGRTYVVFGRASGFPAAFDLQRLLPGNGGNGTVGFVVKGVDRSDYSGVPADGAGDVNGDGVDDLVIAAKGASPFGKTSAGQGYVLFGRTTAFPAVMDLKSLFSGGGGDGSRGFVLNGAHAFDASLGMSISGAGDLNDDGIGDVVIGFPGAKPHGKENAGRTFVVFGRSSLFPPTFELGRLLEIAGGDGSEGFVLNGIDAHDGSGVAVTRAGDFNHDGIDDLVIGAPGASPGNRFAAGESYIVFGRATGFPATFELGRLTPGAGGDGSEGVVLRGANDFNEAGHVNAAGDVNGDGIDDVLIGAPEADAHYHIAGMTFVVFGSARAFPAVIDLRGLLPSP